MIIFFLQSHWEHYFPALLYLLDEEFSQRSRGHKNRQVVYAFSTFLYGGSCVGSTLINEHVPSLPSSVIHQRAHALTFYAAFIKSRADIYLLRMWFMWKSSQRLKKKDFMDETQPKTLWVNKHQQRPGSLTRPDKPSSSLPLLCCELLLQFGSLPVGTVKCLPSFSFFHLTGHQIY